MPRSEHRELATWLGGGKEVTTKTKFGDETRQETSGVKCWGKIS